MSKTTNYQLTLWDWEDEGRLEEVNENFGKLDAASRVVVGSYSGNGAESQTIELGFTPTAVLVASRHYGFMGGGTVYGGLARPELSVHSWQGSQAVLEIVEDGFRVFFRSDNNIYANLSGEGYSYLAIR